MKNLKILTLFALSAMFFTACESEPGGGTTVNGPSVFLSTAGDVSSDVDLAPNSTFSVVLEATKGDLDIQAVTVLEDGVNVDNTRLTVGGTTSSANPILLFAPDTQGFSWTITVDAENEVGVDKVFTFRVQDTNANLDNVSITVSTTVGMPPAVTVKGSGNYQTTPNSAACITIIAATGDSELSTIAILEQNDQGGYDLVSELNTLYYGDLMTNFSDNPHGIPTADMNGFERPIYIKPDYIGIGSYRVVITDAAGSGISGDFTISSGTPVTTEINGVLFNSAGPTGTGGLDLDAGTGVGSANASAEIRDAGIDNALPDAMNWIQRMGGVNGASVRKINGALTVEGIGFDDLNLVDFFSLFYDNSLEFTYMNGNGALFSEKVSAGDVFVVKTTAKDYLIRVSEVNISTIDNKDNYVIDIKH